MEAQTWTITGILGAFSLGVLVLSTAQKLGLDTRIDRLGERMDGLDQQMVQQFNEQNELLRTLIARMDAHETRHAS